MVEFWIIDVIFLVIFSFFVFRFLRKNKKNLKCEGKFLGIPIFMYRTKTGIKFIESFSKKYRKLLLSLRFVIIIVGYSLMGAIIWMIIKTLFIYIRFPKVVEVVKAPPIAPLIPYFPKLFGMESFFPSFYFTYFLVAIAVVMIVHEFSHGIYMKLFGMKIKSTGLVFLGPLLGAFVEEEKKDFEKKKEIDQMTVLGAGVFANILAVIFFLIVYLLFFYFFFTPSGYKFDSYAFVSGVSPSLVDSFGSEIGNHTIIIGGRYAFENLTEVRVNGTDYLAITRALNSSGENNFLFLFLDSPAIRSGLTGTIVQIDDYKIKNSKDLEKFLNKKKPGEKVTIKTLQKNGTYTDYEITLSSHPNNESKPFIGIAIGIAPYKSSNVGFFRYFIYRFMTSTDSSSPFSDQSTYYKPIILDEFVKFIYLMLWWIILINFFVAIFNMLPAGIFDGGRFFYLTIFLITKNKNFSEKAYAVVTSSIVIIFVLMMIFWAVRILKIF